MAINQLIANSPLRTRTPVQSYLQSRDQMQQQRMNNLAMQESRQNMKVKQMAMAKANEERKLEKVALYMRDVKDLQGYATARQELKVNEDIDSPETYAPDRIKSVVEHVYPEEEKFETRTTDEGVSYQVSSLTGEEKKSPRTPETSKTGAPKWMRIAELSRLLDADKGTEGDKAEFEALTKPSVSVNVGAPTKNITRIADDTMTVLEHDGEPIKGEIENEDAYRTAISTRGQTIQAKSEKTGNPISLEEAMRQAHDEMITEGKLIDAKGYEVFGMTPFSKKWVYDPKAQESPEVIETKQPSGITDAYMVSALKLNNLEDTPENRAAIIEAWQTQQK